MSGGVSGISANKRGGVAFDGVGICCVERECISGATASCCGCMPTGRISPVGWLGLVGIGDGFRFAKEGCSSEECCIGGAV